MEKYYRAMVYLKEHPEQIMDAWTYPAEHEAGCLFQFATFDGSSRNIGDSRAGCLTTIRKFDGYVAETPELTKAIRADERIPSGCGEITLDTLPVFAEWQRRLDKELNRA